jgi:hypothetical protein
LIVSWSMSPFGFVLKTLCSVPQRPKRKRKNMLHDATCGIGAVKPINLFFGMNTHGIAISVANPLSPKNQTTTNIRKRIIYDLRKNIHALYSNSRDLTRAREDT